MPPKPIITKPAPNTRLRHAPIPTNTRLARKPNPTFPAPLPHLRTASDEPLMANFGVIQYKKGSHKEINKYLRRIRRSRIEDVPTNPDEGNYELMLRKIRDIDRTMHLRGDGELYKVLFRGGGYIDFGIRSMKFEDLKNLEGKTGIWWAYTSATTNETVAGRYCKGVYIVINTISETRLFNMRDFSGLSCQGEDEVLLERGTKFCIDSVNETEGKVTVAVTLQEK